MARKAVEIELSNGEVWIVSEPGREARSRFIAASTFFQALAEQGKAQQQCNEGVMMPIPEIPDQVMETLDPLIAACSMRKVGEDIYQPVTVEEVRASSDSLGDWTLLFSAICEVLPNFTSPKLIVLK